MLRSSGGKPLADCGHKLRAAGRRQDRDRRHRHLPRRARGRADRKRRRLAQRDQRAHRRPVRQGRDPQRVAALLAAWRSCARRRWQSRSFALSAGVGGNGFDLYDDTRSQVYKGLASETAAHQRGRERDQGPGRRCTAARSPRPTSPPARAATPRASRTSSSARRPLPRRRPRPLRLLLPAAQLDAQVLRAAKSAPSSAATSDGA